MDSKSADTKAETLTGPKKCILKKILPSEYNLFILHQLTYLSEIQKWTKIGNPLPGISALKSLSGDPFFEHLLISPDGDRARRGRAGTDGRTLAPRNAIGASRNNLAPSQSSILAKGEIRFALFPLKLKISPVIKLLDKTRCFSGHRT